MSLRVADRPAGGTELAVERLEVVDLAVIADEAAAIRAPHWLDAADEIDDRQPAVSEADAALGRDALAVRTPVRQQRRTTPDSLLVVRCYVALERNRTKDSTHSNEPYSNGDLTPSRMASKLFT